MGHVHDQDLPEGGQRGGRGVIRLAPGIQLSRDAQAILLVLTAGKVHLNRHALAILELCDGSRSRDRVVVDAVLRSSGTMRAAEVVEFLDAAQSRGWVMEDE
jgi:hypothetical protein